MANGPASSEIDELTAPSPHRPRTYVSGATGLTAPSVGRWKQVHWALLLLASVLLVMAGQGQHFFRDYWAFVARKFDARPFPNRFLLPTRNTGPYCLHWLIEL